MRIPILKRRTWYKVITKIDDRGRATAFVTASAKAFRRPAPDHKSTSRYDWYGDWHGSWEEAMAAVREARGKA